MKTLRNVCFLIVLSVLLLTPSSIDQRIAKRISPTAVPSTAAGRIEVSNPNAKTNAGISETYGKLPLSFEANQGQTASEVRFLSRGSGYHLYLTATEAVLQLWSGAKQAATGTLRRSATSIKMKLVGADPEADVTGREELPGKVNYFIGSDPGKWRTDIPNYAKVEYQKVWPGVNLVYYGNQRQLEYDFVIAPGADPNAIRLSFAGAEKVEIDGLGNLVLQTTGGEVVMQKPFVFQDVDGARKEVQGGYQILESKVENPTVGFHLGEYDPSLGLVIDPVLSYSTFLGGTDLEHAEGIAADAGGNAYVMGWTSSTDFPMTNPFQSMSNGGGDVYVTKLNSSGSARVYSTYIGGGSTDFGFDIAVDSSGNAYLTGRTDSANFPTASAFQGNRKGNSDAFVTKLNPSGSALIYSTYLGGSNEDRGNGIAVDSAGSAYVTGRTQAFTPTNDFPTSSPFQANFGGTTDAFVTKFNPSGSALVYSTYLGGTNTDEGNGIAVDTQGNAYVTGLTFSDNFPTANALQPTGTATTDAFVTKLNPAGAALIYSTFLGGNNDDRGFDIAADSAGNAYITGRTSSNNFPTASPLQATLLGTDSNAFVTKINPMGTAFIYSTYFGPMGTAGQGIAADAQGSAYVAGRGGSGLSKVNPIQGSGSSGAIVAKFNPAGTALIYSTYLGNDSNDEAMAIAVDQSGNAYVHGNTLSDSFPTKNPLQPQRANSGDAFVVKICDVDCSGPVPTPATALACKPDRPQPGTPQSSVSQGSSKANRARLSKLYNELPLTFEENHGQPASQAKFRAHGNGYSLFLAPTEAVLMLQKNGGGTVTNVGKDSSSPFATLRMKFAEANPSPEIKGLDKLRANSNYLIGSDPKLWQTGIALYSRVEYQDIYPGVDLVYYGNQRQLEYDFIVAPGANPKSIKLSFEGAEKIEIDGLGNLVLRTQGGELRQHKPVTYQEVAGVRKSIPSRYVRRGKHEIGFQIGAYDRSVPLMIDPVLSYSTFLGGADRDEGFGIALDSAGNTYVTGRTISAVGFPIQNAFQTAKGPGFDVFVTKLDPTQSGAASLVYSTFLGGNDHDEGFGIAVDAAGNALVTGRTLSGDFLLGFPVTKNIAFQQELRGLSDAFVTKLNAAGNGLLYSTFLGSPTDDEAFSVAVDLAGNAYVTGRTETGPPTLSDFPVKNAFQPFSQGGLDVFVTKIDPMKIKDESLIYSTFLGGVEDDEGSDIAVDAAGNAYVTGRTTSGGPIGKYPVVNAILRDGQGGTDGFVSKLGPSGNTLLYSTFLGGGDSDEGCELTVDSSANVFVVGETDSAGAFGKTPFPTRNAFQPLQLGALDAFVTKLQTVLPVCTQQDINGVTIFCRESLIYSTFLGHLNDESACGIAVDPLGNAYVSGVTLSPLFPLLNALRPVQPLLGGADAFVTKFNATGDALIYSTLLGGNGFDQAFGLALTNDDSAFVTGRTNSTAAFPTLNGLQGTNQGGAFDAFTSRVTSGLQIQKLLNFGSVALGDTIDMPLLITNISDERIVIASATSSATPEFTLMTPVVGFRVEPQTSQTIVLRFIPLSIGARSATLRIISDDPGRPVYDVILTGGGIDPQTPRIEVTPTSLDFGNVGLGQPRDLTVSVRNTGVVSVLTIHELRVLDSHFSVVSPTVPFSLAVGASATVTLRFIPTYFGGLESGVNIGSNAVNSPNFLVPLKGIGGIPGNTTIDVAPTGLDFGNVATGEKKDLPLTVRNTGSVTLVVNALSSNNPRFEVLGPAMPFIVAPAAQQTVTIRFSPNSPGPQTGIMIIPSNGSNSPSFSVSLTGTGTGGPDISTTPETLDFGLVALGQNVSRILIVNNPGDAPLSIAAINSSNPAFSVTLPSVPLSVPAGGAVPLVANFRPTSAASHTGTLLIASSAVNKNVFAVQARGETRDEILATDDGTVETGALQDGLLIVNRLTPSHYPVTLRSVRIFFGQFQGLPSPVGEQIRLVAFVDPSGSGQPPGNPQLLVNQIVTIPVIPSNGGFVDFPITAAAAPGTGTGVDSRSLSANLSALTIDGGDIYVGFQAPRPARGVVFAADSNGPQQQRAFFSTNDGGTYAKLTGLQNPGSLTSGNAGANGQSQLTPVNILAQAGIGGVGVCSYVISPSNQVFLNAGGNGTVTVNAPSGCSWAASSNIPWITFPQNSSGFGSGTVNFAVASSATPRQAVVTIAGLSFTVAQAEKVASVSSASFLRQGLAGEAIASAFGESLSLGTQGAPGIPLPTSLAGTTVKVRDAAGTELFAPLFFVSPHQVNFLMPPGLIPGTATVTVTNSEGASAVGAVLNDIVAPSLFTANADGQGVPAAQVLRVKADGTQIYEPLAVFDAQQARFVPLPIDLGPPGELVFLVLFGTGVRGRSSLAAATVSIGGTATQVLYAGPTGSFVGLDQVNATLPRSLVGRGEVEVLLRVDGRQANPVRINIK